MLKEMTISEKCTKLGESSEGTIVSCCSLEDALGKAGAPLGHMHSVTAEFS